jgi:hypothetical protein
MNIFCRKRLFFSWLVMLLCFGITSLSYSQAVVSVDPVESSSPAVGSQLTIRLKVTNARNVVAYEAGVNFDTKRCVTFRAQTGVTYLRARFSRRPKSLVAESRLQRPLCRVRCKPPAARSLA